MALRPLDVTKSPYNRATKRPPDYGEYQDMRELRSRTIHHADDDPLAEVDFWSQIGDPKESGAAYRRAWMLKHAIVQLAKGIWSIATFKVSETESVLVARFEGYEPWWIHASKSAVTSAYQGCVRSDITTEIRPPRIPSDQYETDTRTPLYEPAGQG